MGMQPEKYVELEDRASQTAELDIFKKMEARQRVVDEIERMKNEGKALELSDEEMKMLHSFRLFKLRMRRDGETFTWQTRRPEGVQIAKESGLVVRPEEVSQIIP